MPLVDRYHRPVRDLRISVTDRCNYRCNYCMPFDEYTWIEKAEVLSFEEIIRLATLFIQLGVEKIRLTGGEPLVRRDLEKLIAELSPCEKVVVICAGTNGHITGEDVVFAGGLVNELRRRTADRCELNDEARLAAAAWESLVGGLAHLDRLFRVLRDSRGGRNLVELGFENDIRLAASIDTVPVIGELLRDGRVVKR